MITFDYADLLTAFPEIFLLLLACSVLIIDLFLPEKSRSITSLLTKLVVIFVGISILVGASDIVRLAFFEMYKADPISDFMKTLTCGIVLIILVYSHRYIENRSIFRGEFFTLNLFALLGMMIMISANHFLILYLGLEMLSLSLYSLVALSRGVHESSEAAVKYFILGALASGLLLYGISMIYGATGELSLSGVASSLSDRSISLNLALFGLVFIVAGIAFKLGAVPFHMWVPDVYQGAPTSITILIGTAPKIAAFAFIFRILVEGMGDPRIASEWQQMLLMLAILSIGLGNFVAIAQTNIKRMLAYSTMAHMGFVLLGLSSGSTNGIIAAMFYVITYVLASLTAFGTILFLARKGFESDNIEDFKGLSHTNPWVAFLMLISMLSMAGIPPIIGFWGKLSILQVIVESGFIGVAIFTVVLSLIGAFYYLRIIKFMFFDKIEESREIDQKANAFFLLTVNGLSLLILGFVPGVILGFCKRVIELSI